ncbi:hypothetical protein GCM10027447_34770 [Glycomyces halotolerans]
MGPLDVSGNGNDGKEVEVMGDFWWVWLLLAASLLLNVSLLRREARRIFRYWNF